MTRHLFNLQSLPCADKNPPQKPSQEDFPYAKLTLSAVTKGNSRHLFEGFD
jgi:hypothetical protein